MTAQTPVGMEESARAASLADLDVVTAMAAQARSDVAEARGGDLWITAHAEALPLDHHLTQAIEATDQSLVVGCLDDVVVGYTWTTLRDLRDGRRLADIAELFVLPGTRGVGVGEVMLAEVLAWARAQGCFGIDSLALPGDRATKNFFETFGLKARAIAVHRLLGDD